MIFQIKEQQELARTSAGGEARQDPELLQELRQFWRAHTARNKPGSFWIFRAPDPNRNQLESWHHASGKKSGGRRAQSHPKLPLPSQTSQIFWTLQLARHAA